jgi:thiopurine S-methyltransferase
MMKTDAAARMITLPRQAHLRRSLARPTRWSTACTTLILMAAATMMFSSSSSTTNHRNGGGIITRAFAADPLPSLDTWQSKWDTNKTAWHRAQVHPSLVKYGDDLLENFPAGGAKILVPLCGKSVDLVHLAQKKKVAQVVGVEGVTAAVQALAQEHPDLELTALDQCDDDTLSDFKVWEGNSIRILNGNFFALERHTTLYDGIWDRAALVAIDPASRDRYVNQLGALLNKEGGGRILLATLERPGGDVTTGPPYSIDETEVRRLFGNKPWVKQITLLDNHSALGMEPWYMAIGMYLKFGGDVRERIFLIETQ